jgi:hypothetical protein
MRKSIINMNQYRIKEELRIEIRTLCILQKAKQNYRQIDFDRAV